MIIGVGFFMCFRLVVLLGLVGTFCLRLIVAIFGSEANLWKTPVQKAEAQLGEVKPEIKEAIVEIIKGNFTFEPLGYDGTYGSLTIGKTSDFLDVNIVNQPKKKQGLDHFLSET